MRVTVQICSMNRKAILERALRALFEQTYDKNDFEIIVVDDGSTDGTSDMVNELIKESPSFKSMKEELGVVGAENGFRNCFNTIHSSNKFLDHRKIDSAIETLKKTLERKSK